jgi:hypothetical protein
MAIKKTRTGKSATSATKKAAAKLRTATPKKATSKKVAKKAPAKGRASAKRPSPKARVSKKPATKKRSAKRTGLRTLVVAVNDDRFWVVNGPVLSNIFELHEALLHEMLPEQFLYHAMGAQNDFAQWVEHVLEDAASARVIRRAEDQYEAATKLKRQLRYYKQ